MAGSLKLDGSEFLVKEGGQFKITNSELKLKSSGNTVVDSSGNAVLSESGGTVTLNKGTLGSAVVLGTTSSPISNNLVFADGKGIDFSSAAGSNAGSSSAVLDDYEEGTWTPAFTGATFSYNESFGVYVKVGNLVTVHAYMNVTWSSATGSFHINNLPFTVFNNNARGGQDTVNCQFGVTFTGYVTFEPINNSTQGFFENNISGSNRADMGSAHFASTGFAIRFSSTYRSAS